MSKILQNINLVQSRLQTLIDILTDTTYLMNYNGLPPCNASDLKQSIQECESVFHTLATVRTRLERSTEPSKL